MDGDTKGLQRPGLADVLAALTGDERDWWDYQLFLARTVTLQSGGVYTDSEGLRNLRRDGAVPWITKDTREALELLQTRGLAPEDDVRRRFIAGPEWRTGAAPDSPLAMFGVPFTIPDLVAYASLGPAAILRAEELARETVARLRPWGCPQTERVVWRVGEREPREEIAWESEHGTYAVSRDGLGLSPQYPTEQSAHDLWLAGLCVDSITADAVTLVVPPVGAP